jgi:hypothetical protein
MLSDNCSLDEMVCKLGQKKSAATTLTAPNSSNKPDSYRRKAFSIY